MRGASVAACACVALVASALVAASCGDEPTASPAVAPNRGVARRRPHVEVASTETATRAQPMRDPAAPPEQRVLLERIEPAPIEIVEQVEGAGSEERLRNLQSELEAKVGDPVPCLSEEDRHLRRDIGIDVAVEVTRSGIVTHVAVNGPGISADALECIRSRLSSARFQPLDRAQTIRTSLVLRRTDTSAEGS